MVKKNPIQCIDVIHYCADKKNDSDNDDALNRSESSDKKTLNKDTNKCSKEIHTSK